MSSSLAAGSIQTVIPAHTVLWCAKALRIAPNLDAASEPALESHCTVATTLLDGNVAGSVDVASVSASAFAAVIRFRHAVSNASSLGTACGSLLAETPSNTDAVSAASAESTADIEAAACSVFSMAKVCLECASVNQVSTTAIARLTTPAGVKMLSRTAGSCSGSLISNACSEDSSFLSTDVLLAVHVLHRALGPFFH